MLYLGFRVHFPTQTAPSQIEESFSSHSMDAYFIKANACAKQVLKLLILLSNNNNNCSNWAAKHLGLIECGGGGEEKLLVRVNKRGEYQVHECGSHNRRAPPTWQFYFSFTSLVSLPRTMCESA